jgi:two-component system LytT family response regulator
MKQTAILIDDIESLREYFKGVLSKINSDIEVVAEADNLIDGIKLIKKLNPSVVFLDIEMPNHSGLEILDFFSDDEINFHLVFVTAHSHYAVNAFELSAVDFMLKPVTTEALEKTLAKIKKSVSNNLSLNTLKENLATKEASKIALNSSDSISIVPIAEILYLKAEGPYTQFFLENGNSITVSKSIMAYDDILPQSVFFRAHRSYVVNLNQIRQIDKKNFVLKLSNGDEVPLSQHKKNELIEKLSL